MPASLTTVAYLVAGVLFILALRGLSSPVSSRMGNYLGMTLETVSRALSRLARDKVIVFAEKGRRDVRIPDLDALSTFVQRCLAPAPLLQ